MTAATSAAAATIPDPAIAHGNVSPDSGSSPVATYLERFQELAALQEQVVGKLSLITVLAEHCDSRWWMDLARSLASEHEWVISPEQYLDSAQDLEMDLKKWSKFSKKMEKLWDALTENQRIGLLHPSQLSREFLPKHLLGPFLKPAKQNVPESPGRSCTPSAVVRCDSLWQTSTEIQNQEQEKQQACAPVITVGSKVRLKSGGPIMTVTAESHSYRTFVCTWFTSTSGMLGGGGGGDEGKEWRADSIEVRQESLDLVESEK